MQPAAGLIEVLLTRLQENPKILMLTTQASKVQAACCKIRTPRTHVIYVLSFIHEVTFCSQGPPNSECETSPKDCTLRDRKDTCRVPFGKYAGSFIARSSHIKYSLSQDDAKGQRVGFSGRPFAVHPCGNLRNYTYLDLPNTRNHSHCVHYSGVNVMQGHYDSHS